MKPGEMLFMLVMVLGAACAPKGNYVWARDVPPPPPAAAPQAAQLRPGDSVQIIIKGQPELSAEGKIRADGSVAMPVIGAVVLAGARLDEAAKRVQQRLTSVVVNPEVTVSLTARAPVPVTVAGEVRTPGKFELEARDGVLGAIARAGGLTEFAKKSRIFVLRGEPEPMRIRFDYGELQRGEAPASFRLQEGDVIVVE